MANYMAEVAKMLGVELGEEFEIKYPSPCTVKTTAVFSENGFRVVETNEYILTPNRNEYILHSLLKGDLAVKRRPWKPNIDDLYYYISQDGYAHQGMWYKTSNTFGFNLYKLGNCYRTQQAAEANRDKWIAFYESDEVLEV